MDISITCINCGGDFWFTAGEQAFYAEHEFFSPKRCPACRAKRRGLTDSSAPGPTSTQLPIQTPKSARPPAIPFVPVPPMPLLIPPTFGISETLFLDDIHRLLDEASSPIENRRRTVFEWLRGQDIRAEQIARKLAAAKTADEMAQQRAALYAHVEAMIRAKTSAQLALMEAETKLLEAALRQEELREQLQQRRALSGDRLENARLGEYANQKKLLTAVQPEPDQHQRVADEHRRRVAGHVQARQGVLSDFLTEVRQICNSRVSLHEKALRLTETLSIFEMNEEALPDDARRILNASQERRYGR